MPHPVVHFEILGRDPQGLPAIRGGVVVVAGGA